MFKNCSSEIFSSYHQLAGVCTHSGIFHSDSEFLEGIDFLFEKQILSVPTREAVTESEWKIPEWVQTPASWWYEEKISDEQFLNIIENLVKREIIVI